MADLIQIPVDSNESGYREIVSLGGKSIILEFLWNERAERWHMNIFDATEGPILLGVPLHVDADLVGRYKIPAMPQGYIMLFDVSKQSIEIGRNELGTRGILTFQAREEVA